MTTAEKSTQPYAYRIGGGWGHHVSWGIGDPRTVTTRHGLLRRKRTRIVRGWYSHGKYPQPGDAIIHEGRTGGDGNLWRVTRADRQSNPDDMVIGDAEFVGIVSADNPVHELRERGWDSPFV